MYFTGHIPCYLRSSRENQELICGYLLIGERIQNFFHGGGGGGGGQRDNCVCQLREGRGCETFARPLSRVVHECN